ncbi:MAG: YpdA family putative bacillithiol disulfide reductase [Rhodothermales bacterium]
MYDVIIIGAGPVGLACAIEAQREGLSAKIIDKGALTNSLTGYPLNMEFFSTAELLEIGDHPFPTRGAKPTREEALSYYQKVASAEKLDINLFEKVETVEGEHGAFSVITAKSTYTTRKVVVVTGFFDLPNTLQVPGDDLPKVTHYFTEPFRYARQKVAIIGAKNSAAKAALQCHRAGARVSIIVRGDEISEKVKYWIRPDLVNRIKEGAIKAYYNSTLLRITESSLHLNTPDGEVVVENDWVIAMTGYQPNYAFLKTLGITINSDEYNTPIHNEHTFETERAGMFMAGTVCGGLKTSRWFIENGRHHAKLIMKYIAHGIVGDIAAFPDPVAENANP